MDVRRGGDRAVSRTAGIETRHSFSSGAHYDASNTHFGILVAHDEHLVQPGAGFDMHEHRGLEIVSWVSSGALLHEDSAGRRTTVTPGVVQHLSAGSGIEHAERNAGAEPLRFVQMWLLGGRASPAYRVEPGTMLRLDNAILQVVCLDAGETTLPDAPFVHVFVAGGQVALGGDVLTAGDAARITDSAGTTVAGTAELLMWAMFADATPDPPAR